MSGYIEHHSLNVGDAAYSINTTSDLIVLGRVIGIERETVWIVTKDREDRALPFHPSQVRGALVFKPGLYRMVDGVSNAGSGCQVKWFDVRPPSGLWLRIE